MPKLPLFNRKEQFV